MMINQGEDTMEDEKWDRFTVTGSVRDYLEYRAGAYDTSDTGAKREEHKHGADNSAEWDRALRNADWRL
jgi:hypothetical protein